MTDTIYNDAYQVYHFIVMGYIVACSTALMLLSLATYWLTMAAIRVAETLRNWRSK